MPRPWIVACCGGLILLTVVGCEQQTQGRHAVVPAKKNVQADGKRDDPVAAKPLPPADSAAAYKDLREAVKRGDAAAIKRLLVSGVNVNATHHPVESMILTPLMMAAGHKSKQIVRILLSAGAKLDSNSRAYGTALHLAAWYGCLENVKLLLAAGADVNAYSIGGYPVLHRATSQGHLDVVKLLVKKGAKINAQRDIGELINGRTGLTALIIAANWGRTDVVQFLLEQGADPNLTDSWGGHDTALMYAAVYGREEIVVLLLKHGAKVDHRDSRGRTALHRAVETGTPAVEKLLTDAGATIDPRELQKLRLKRKQYEERRERAKP